MEEWRRVLTELAEEFHRGRCTGAAEELSVDVQALRPEGVCRLDVSALEEEEEDEGSGGEPWLIFLLCLRQGLRRQQ